jgi:AraC-like DNA-binding protein
MAQTAAKSDLTRLAMMIAVHAPYDGIFELRHPGVHAIRISATNHEAMHGLQQSSACIVAQGAKSVLIGEDVHTYEAGGIAVYSVDLPLAFQITRASRAEPYLNLKLDLDPAKLAELTMKVYPNGLPRTQDSRPLYLGQAEPQVIDAAIRLLELMARPEDAELIAPLVVDEILIRLLRGPIGSRVAQIGRADSSLNRVGKAVSWLRTNFDQPIDVDDLAKLVNLSVSAFHRQFKAVTSMSPLQYQKALRLQEARRLMLAAMMDAGDASRRVGYTSASQFSREYGRFFGSAPTKDILRLRGEGARAGAASG